MSWRAAHAIHIHAPFQEPYGDENWVEQILGTTIKPIVEQFGAQIRWIWVTRYWEGYSNNTTRFGYPLPAEYIANEAHRYIVFRLSAQASKTSAIQSTTLELVRRSRCFADPRGWMDYDVIGDLGGNRFVPATADAEQRGRRAYLIANFIDGTVRLMLDALSVDEYGKWSTELNSEQDQNPEGSPFESIHHLFCNATHVPTSVILEGRASRLAVGTYWMPNHLDLNVQPDRDFQGKVRIRY